MIQVVNPYNLIFDEKVWEDYINSFKIGLNNSYWPTLDDILRKWW